MPSPRAKIRTLGRNVFGQLSWLATCNGPDCQTGFAAYSTDLPKLHARAVEHVAEHRTAAALDRAHNHGERSR